MATPNVIGEGTYGCAIKPSLKCADNKLDYTNKISKILLASNAASEMKEYKLIDSADKKRNFYLGKPKICKPKMDAETETAVKKCENKKLYSLPDTELLIMEDGGLNLKDYAEQMSKKNVTPENRAKMENVCIEMQRMLHALYVLEQNDLIHHDLKPQNIVYNESKQRMNLIDFGFMTKISKVLKESKKSGYWLAYKMHWSFPFEIIYYNKINFKLATIGDRDSRIAKYIKNFETNKNHMDIFFEDANIDTAAGKKQFMEVFSHFMANLQLEQYEEFLTKSVSTIDVYGVGMTMAVVLKHTHKFMPMEITRDLSEIASEMFHPNVFLRLSPLAVLEKYEAFLEKHGLLKKHNMRIENHFLLNGADKPIVIPANIIKAKPMSQAKLDAAIEKMDENLEKAKEKYDQLSGYHALSQKEREGLSGYHALSQKEREGLSGYHALSQKEREGLKPCPSGKERNPKTRRCVTNCPEGYQRDADFKCVKSVVEKGKLVVEKGKSKTEKSKPCPSGKERNPKTRRCVTNCPEGYQRDADFKCVKPKTEKVKPDTKKERKEQLRECIAECKNKINV